MNTLRRVLDGWNQSTARTVARSCHEGQAALGFIRPKDVLDHTMKSKGRIHVIITHFHKIKMTENIVDVDCVYLI